MQVCPSATGSWEASNALTDKPPTLAYRKIMGLEQDDVFREYLRLPIFQDVTAGTCGDHVGIVRAMFCRCRAAFPGLSEV